MAFVRFIQNWDPWSDPRSLWNPWAQVRRLQDAMNSAFENRDLGPPTRGWRPLPPINVAQTNDAVVVTAELPGVKPEDLSLSITGNTLTLKGCRKPRADEKSTTYHRRERTVGEFARSIELPKKVDSQKAAAEFDQGILTVRIPKSADALHRQIPVKAG